MSQPISLLRPRIIALGDSITQYGSHASGWLQLLQCYYERKADVINRGFSGYNTNWAKLWLQTGIHELKNVWREPSGMAAPILITVWFGANDSALEGSVQAVDIKQYGENLKDIVQLLRHEHQKCNIVFITPPPCDTETWRRHLIEKYNIPFDSKPNRTFENAQIFAKRALEVADELSIPVVDINTIFTSQKLPFAAFLNDGLHLSDAGNALVFDSLKALINHKFPNIAPGRLLCDGPFYDRIDVDNPTISFAPYGDRK